MNKIIITLFSLSLILSTYTSVLLANQDKQVTKVTVTWSAPITRENGDTLKPEEIASYDIKYSLADEDPKVVTGITSGYTVDDITSGDYSFAVRAIDTDGLESKWSQEVGYSFNPPMSPVNLEIIFSY